MRNRLAAVCVCLLMMTPTLADELPDTGISGVYEVMVGVDDGDYAVRYFAEFGFRVVAQARLEESEASSLYGVASGVTVYRLQNGDIDSHGLLRILAWDEPIGPGVGYGPPETVGTRMAVMRTEDIVRLADVFADWRSSGEVPLLVAGPVYDDLYDATEGAADLFNRRVGVREMAVYGSWFNHVFFQRYGYSIPGYGTLNEASPLRATEFTHHDFVVAGDLDEVTDYYSSVFGMQAENDTAVIDGDWQAGPREVFQMAPGRSHWYRGFVSPNNICGKLKFFSLHGLHAADDRSARQRPGELGITLHSLWTPKLAMVHELATAADLAPSPIAENEFGERSFVVTGPDGATWQLIEGRKTKNSPTLNFQLQPVNN